MSLRDIADEIEASSRREKRRAGEKVADLQSQARLLHRVIQLVSAAVWAPKEYPTPEAAFPGLLKADNTLSEEGCSVPLWQRQKTAMTAYVEAHNSKFKKGGKPFGRTGRRNKGQSNS